MVPESPVHPPKASRGRVFVVLAIILALIAAVAASMIILRHQPQQNSPGSQAPRVTPKTSQSSPDKSTQRETLPAAAAATKKTPLPELIAGTPLDDNHFAQISAEIVIAAQGLKQDANWTANLEAYMGKMLDKHGIDIEDYNEYAMALYANPDRGRAVAENIMRRVEQKIGHRMSMDKLPMFKFDAKQVKQLEKKLR